LAEKVVDAGEIKSQREEVGLRARSSPKPGWLPPCVVPPCPNHKRRSCDWMTGPMVLFVYFGPFNMVSWNILRSTKVGVNTGYMYSVWT
jgi:hypothetical protein